MLRNIQITHKNKLIWLFFQDDACMGQKGRTARV